VTKSVVEHIKELSDNEEKLELLIESKRVAAAVRLQDELHPPQNSEDCPICFENSNMCIRRLLVYSIVVMVGYATIAAMNTTPGA